jgi:hypothetical protein
MIQLNLLPDVKQEYIKTQATKRLVVAVSFVASAAALGVLLIALSTVYLVQKKLISDLESNIRSSSATLKNTDSISDILTVQSQLGSLASLNAQKPVTSRVFGYLSQITPPQATISDLRLDYTTHSIVISGNAPSLDVVNAFVDGLKFTNYTVKSSTTSTPAFSTVVLSSFSRSAKSATYSISMTFDPTILNVANDVTLSVGSASQPSEQPSVIFKKDS